MHFFYLRKLMTDRDYKDSTSKNTIQQFLDIDFSNVDSETVAELLSAIFDTVSLSREDRVQLLGSALVMEALRPHWVDGNSPGTAHRLLRASDPELAATVESIAPMLLSRAESRENARKAVKAVEELLSR
jgi:DNA topoisomerase VI subunit B